jgi:hypothetical protein
MVKRMVAVWFSPVRFLTEKRREKGWREVGGGGARGQERGALGFDTERLRGGEWLALGGEDHCLHAIGVLSLSSEDEKDGEERKGASRRGTGLGGVGLCWKEKEENTRKRKGAGPRRKVSRPPGKGSRKGKG